MTRETFINERTALFWSVSAKNKANISDTLLVETILNYGDEEDVRILFRLMGTERVAEIFYAATENRSRHNYLPVVLNFFTLYFNRHVRQYPI